MTYYSVQIRDFKGETHVWVTEDGSALASRVLPTDEAYVTHTVDVMTGLQQFHSFALVSEVCDMVKEFFGTEYPHIEWRGNAWAISTS